MPDPLVDVVRLSIVEGDVAEGSPRRIDLEPGVGVRLGRGFDCHLRVKDAVVSRLHAEIAWVGEASWLIHRSASNPTYVNGSSVDDRVELSPSDEIQLANHVVMRLSGVAPAPADAPAPDVVTELPPPTIRRPPPQPSGPDIATEHVRIAIVGAGPAGLAAAVQAASRGAPHVVLERGKIANTIERYQKGKLVMDEPSSLPLQPELDVGFAAGSREEVLAEWNDKVARSGANLRIGPEFELSSIEGSKGAFRLICKGGETFEATHVVLSIGVQGNLRSFGVPGDDLPHVTYQLDDPAEYQQKRAVVFGVGDAGIENALALVEFDNEVTIVNRGTEMVRAKARNRRLAAEAIKAGDLTYFTNTVIDHFEPGAVVLRTDDGEVRLEADLVIGRLGAVPPRKLLQEFGVEFPSDDGAAVPEVTPRYESNVPGIHVVGALAGYPLIKNCMNQGYEVVEHIVGRTPTPADEPVLAEKFRRVRGSVGEILEAILGTVPLFAGLTPIQLREFLFDSEVEVVEAGDVVFELNDFSDQFYTVLRGEIELSEPQADQTSGADRPAGMEKSFTHRVGRHEFFGEDALISGRRRSATARAVESTVLIASPRIGTRRLMKSVDAVRQVIDDTFVQRALHSLLGGEGVSAEALEALAHTATIRTFAAGEPLFAEGDAPDGLHLIRRGSATISLEQDGREKVVNYVQAGRYVGEMALLAPQRRRTRTVTANVQTETILLPVESIIPFLEQHPRLRSALEACEGDVPAAVEPPRGTIVFLVAQTKLEATDLLIIDESLCIRCNNCEKACADTHQGVSRLDREAGPTYQTSSNAQLHLPTACQHCEHPKCMEDCPPDAIRRDPSGEVFIKDNCIACGNCVSNCPYDVIQMAHIEEYRPRGLLWRLLLGEGRTGARDEEASHTERAVKCDLCRELRPRRGESQPRAACVASCPTGAIARVDPRRFVDEILEPR